MDRFNKVSVTISHVDKSQAEKDGSQGNGACGRGYLPATKNRFPYTSYICSPMRSGRYLIAVQEAKVYFEATEIEVHLSGKHPEKLEKPLFSSSVLKGQQMGKQQNLPWIVSDSSESTVYLHVSFMSLAV